MPTRINQPIANPYGGAALLDSTPYLQLHLQKQAEEKAKQAAAQKAYDDLMKDPNPEGIREVDTKDFYDMANQLRQFGIQNKEFIKDPTKDGGAKRNEFMRKANEISLFTQGSKDRKAKQHEFAPILTNPETAGRLGKPFFEQYEQLQKPLKESFGFTFNPQNIYREKPVDEKEFLDFITRGEKPSETKTRTKTGNPLLDKEITTISYADPKKMGENAKLYLKTDKRFNQAIDDLWDAEGIKSDAQGNPTRTVSPFLNELNQVHQKYYGKPIQTKDDLAAAYGIQRVAGASKKEDFVTNEAAKIKAQEQSRKNVAAFTHGLTQDKVPFVPDVKDFEALVKNPDAVDKNGQINLNVAHDIARSISAALMDKTGNGTFMMPFPASVSQKAGVKNDPQYQKSVKESADMLLGSLADVIESKKVAKDEAGAKEAQAVYNKYVQDLNKKNLSVEDFAKLNAEAFNAVNKANGVSHRYTPEQVRKETPMLVRTVKDGRERVSVLPLGSNEFRQYYDAAKMTYQQKNKQKSGSYQTTYNSSGGNLPATADDIE